MKRLIFLLFASVLLAACHDEPDFRLNPEAMISIKPDPKGWNNTGLKSTEYLTPLEIVERTTCIRFKNENVFGNGDVYRGFDVGQRDFTIPALKMFGTDIIDQSGEYCPEFIEGHDMILEHWANSGLSSSARDTIAYIPNSVIRAAEDSIKTALAANDIEAVYRIFNNAFTFRPITGAEWLALKMQGLQ